MRWVKLVSFGVPATLLFTSVYLLVRPKVKVATDAEMLAATHPLLRMRADERPMDPHIRLKLEAIKAAYVSHHGLASGATFNDQVVNHAKLNRRVMADVRALVSDEKTVAEMARFDREAYIGWTGLPVFEAVGRLHLQIANLKRRRGRNREAAAELLETMRIGHALAQPPFASCDTIWTAAFWRIRLTGQQECLVASSEPEMLELLRLIPDERDVIEQWHSAMRVQVETVLKRMTRDLAFTRSLYPGDQCTPSFMVNWDAGEIDQAATVRLATNTLAEDLENVEKPFDAHPQKCKKLALKIAEGYRTNDMADEGAFALMNRMEIAALPNSRGLKTVQFFFMADVVGGIYSDLAHSSGTRLFLALSIYKKRHGSLPSDLAVLIDEGLLREIPLDPYTRKPFHYSPAESKIWSTGSDCSDDKGAKREDISWVVG